MNNTIEQLVLYFDESFSAAVILGAFLSAFISIYFSLVARKKLPIAHNIAMIGFPRSGKTTLITSLFAEIFSRRIPSISITPRGEETINRVNDDIARLESGEKLGATTDQDIFAYRAEMVTGGSIFSRRYKIEIGDFPGEDSEELSSKDIQWLHDLPYFKWVLNADAFIFVIDSEKVINNKDSKVYRSQLISSFRAAWHKLKDHHYDGVSELRHKPIVLAFTKADLLTKELTDSLNKNVTQNKVNSSMEEDKITGSLLKEYSDLIQFFKSETTRFSVVFSSSFAKDPSSGVRVGAKKLLRGILPR